MDKLTEGNVSSKFTLPEITRSNLNQQRSVDIKITLTIIHSFN